jgi:hypothetical protein
VCQPHYDAVQGAKKFAHGAGLHTYALSFPALSLQAASSASCITSYIGDARNYLASLPGSNVTERNTRQMWGPELSFASLAICNIHTLLQEIVVPVVLAQRERIVQLDSLKAQSWVRLGTTGY